MTRILKKVTKRNKSCMLKKVERLCVACIVEVEAEVEHMPSCRFVYRTFFGLK